MSSTSVLTTASRIEYVPPPFWHFPPMYTLQPVTDTREKQLKAWRDIVLQYCRVTSTTQIVPLSFPLFTNAKLPRSLSAEGIRAVCQSLITEKLAEWEDEEQRVLFVHTQSVEALAGEVYRWARNKEILGTVYTLFELHSGDEYQDSGFHGCDPLLLRRALQYLQSVNKCAIIPGATADEDGVKFLAAT